MTEQIDPSIIVVAAALAAAVIFGFALWLWWWLPKWQVNHLRLTIYDPKAWADVEDNFRKTIGQLLVGGMVLVGAGVGAAVAYRQLLGQQQTSRELLVSNQVSKGFEQLGQAGSDKLIVRLGGIYALGGVMNTSEQYHQPVLEALSAFVRDGTQTVTGDGPPAPDFQAALTVIGRRKAIGEADLIYTGLSREGYPREGKPDLNNAHIPKAELSHADLRGANLFEANLSSASLFKANLSGAGLFKANLSSANLGDAVVSGALLVEANLSGGQIVGADLSDAILTRADLSGAVLINANLSGADLSSAVLSGAVLSGAVLGGATITQVQLDQACGLFVKLDPGLTIKPCQ